MQNKDFEIISHILENVEMDIIKQKEIDPNFIPNYAPSALRSATMIFHHVVNVEMWQMCEANNFDMDVKEALFAAFGKALNCLIQAATDKDPKDFYDTTIVTKDGFITKLKM